MRTRRAGWVALVAAAGVWMGLSGGPALAAKSNANAPKASAANADRPLVLSKYKKHKRATAARKSRTAQVRHVKKHASRVSDSAARKADTADNSTKKSKSELPPEIANARAEALAADDARNIAALDNTNVSVSNGAMIAASDPPKDNDAAPMDNTAASEDASPPAPVAVAPPQPPLPAGKIVRAVPSGERPVVKAEDSDTWNKTSLIGKIFIAFGGLLTLASAARLLIA